MKKFYIFKITIFVLIILIPIFNFNFKSNQISTIDNRMLMDANDIISEGDLTSNIESYVNDRIGFRTEMVNAYIRGMDSLFGEMVHPIYQYGQNGYIFSKVSTMTLNKEFNDVYAEFISNFQKYCNDRGIDFLYAVEPSKATVYTEYLPEGYTYNTQSLDYFINLLQEKNINFVNNADTLLEAKNETQVFDPMFDAGHWNETGAIIGISAILDRLNMLDSRVGKFDINKYESKEYINTTLSSSYFPINETTIKYELINSNAKYIKDYEDEIVRSENFAGYSHYINNSNEDKPRILIFSGSYFNNKEKFLVESFSEVMKIHNYHNVINYDYYINIFNPDIVLFESTEYTHSDYYFPISSMENVIHNEYIKNYTNLEEDDFVSISDNSITLGNGKLTNFLIPFSGDDVLCAYANLNGRFLDCKIESNEMGRFLTFSIITSEIEDLTNFDLYFISKDEKRYEVINCYIN